MLAGASGVHTTHPKLQQGHPEQGANGCFQAAFGALHGGEPTASLKALKKVLQSFWNLFGANQHPIPGSHPTAVYISAHPMRYGLWGGEGQSGSAGDLGLVCFFPVLTYFFLFYGHLLLKYLNLCFPVLL